MGKNIISKGQFGPHLAKKLHKQLFDEGGFTVNLRTGKEERSGWIISEHPRKGHEQGIPLSTASPKDIEDYVEPRRQVLAQKGLRLGGWKAESHNPPEAVLDVSRRVPEHKVFTALATMAKNKQEEMFNPGTGQTYGPQPFISFAASQASPQELKRLDRAVGRAYKRGYRFGQTS